MASYRKAIDQFCKSCIYDAKSGLGTWRQQTEGCTLTDCPLWPFRPKSASLQANIGQKESRPARRLSITTECNLHEADQHEQSTAPSE